MTTTRTTQKQIAIVKGAKSVKGIYFTMEFFINQKMPNTPTLDNGFKNTQEVGFPIHRKDTIELEEYRELALDWLNNQLAMEKTEKAKAKEKTPKTAKP